MLTALLLAGVVLSATPGAPVAMVLESRGSIKLKSGQAEPRVPAFAELLSESDELSLSGPGDLTVVYLADGHREHLKAAGTVTIGATGCLPHEAVETELPPSAEQKALVQGLKQLGRTDRGAVAVFRSPESAPPSGMVPAYGGTVLGLSPTFAWPAVEGAQRYAVDVWAADAKQPLWSAETSKPTIEYPATAAKLQRDEQYIWRVVAHASADAGAEGGDVVVSKFSVLPATAAAELAALNRPQSNSSPTDLILLLGVYKAYRLYDQAIEAGRQLVRQMPKAAEVHLLLADVYTLAGRADEAASERRQAALLGRAIKE
jgi:hypothetical protein